MKIFALLLLIVIVEGNNSFGGYTFPVSDTDPNCSTVLFNIHNLIGNAYFGFCDKFSALMKIYKCCLPLIAEKYLKLRKVGDRYYLGTVPNFGNPGWTCARHMKAMSKLFDNLKSLLHEWNEDGDYISHAIDSVVKTYVGDFRKAKASALEKKHTPACH